MDTIEALSVKVEFTPGDEDNNVRVDLNPIGPDQDETNYVWLICIVSLVRGMAAHRGLSEDEMWQEIEEFRDRQEPWDYDRGGLN